MTCKTTVYPFVRNNREWGSITKTHKGNIAFRRVGAKRVLVRRFQFYADVRYC